MVAENATAATLWWYIEQDGGETKGPVSQAEITRLVASQKLGETATVWQPEYGENWRGLNESGLLARSVTSNTDYPVAARWQKAFKRIDAAYEISDEKERNKALFQPSLWSIPGFIFGPIYYLYLRMWHKAVAIFALVFVLAIIETVAQSFISSQRLLRTFNFIIPVICAMYAKRDYYDLKMRNEVIWSWSPLKIFSNIYAGIAVVVALIIILMCTFLLDDEGSVRSENTHSTVGSTFKSAPRINVASAEQENVGISGAYCTNGKNTLQLQTFMFRKEGIPVDSAENSFTHETNLDYQQFMMASVRELYQRPELMRQKLSDGSWMRACIETVRGF